MAGLDFDWVGATDKIEGINEDVSSVLSTVRAQLQAELGFARDAAAPTDAIACCGTHPHNPLDTTEPLNRPSCAGRGVLASGYDLAPPPSDLHRTPILLRQNGQKFLGKN